MESTHTPGPWTATPDLDNEGDWHIVGTGDFVTAIVMSEPAARLIAAAPDLLAALRLLTATTMFAEAGGETPVQEARRLAIAAIAKAEGTS